MKEFKGRVAVVTGAGSGIGRALAVRCAREGMRVVLADINEPDLAQAEQELQAIGAPVLSVKTDVSKLSNIEALAQETIAAFSAVHLLINNAGVIAGSTVWDSTLADWQWVVNINLWGVVYGCKVFAPIMMAQDTDCHIVNTASATALLSNNPIAPYSVSKHAVLGLSENMFFWLDQCNSKVKISVLCPGWVRTRIMDAARNRPPELQNEPAGAVTWPEAKLVGPRAIEHVPGRGFVHIGETGLTPEQVADMTFKAIVAEQFYIVTHHEDLPYIERRTYGIVHETHPGMDNGF